MKAQISRDSFRELSDYSAVYQQQGRMLTDADWNELVRILKERMDRTVGAAIDSGSPRERGIIHSAERSYEEFIADPRFQWGRVYVDGIYAELRGDALMDAEVAMAPMEARVRHNWVPLNLDSDFSDSSLVFAAMQTTKGGNPAAVRMRENGEGALEVKIEEETSKNSEVSHVEEQVAYLATRPGLIHDIEGRVVGEAGLIETNQPDGQTWHTVRLSKAIDKPVVIMQLMSYKGSNPSHMRIRNVEGRSFKFKIEEWDYLDGVHTTEKIAYIVLEEGNHTLAGGRPIEAGKASVDNTWTNVSFTSGLDGAPVVLSQCQTFNDSGAVVTRQQNASANGLQIRLQEEENATGGHNAETVGYLAGNVSSEQSIKNLIRYQRDYPSNPWDKLEDDAEYHLYVDIWERLVVAFEDENLKDIALHGADTCVRTQTMAQIKLAKQAVQLDELHSHGSARIAVDVLATSPAPAHDCNREAQGDRSVGQRNTLLRVEVHDVNKAAGEISGLTLKWSMENGAEERENDDTLGNFMSPDYVYECFSTDTEKHLGEHLLENVNGWQPLRGRLYSRTDYNAARLIPGSPAKTMPRIRRWDGSVGLTRTADGQWQVKQGSTSAASITGSASSRQSLQLALEAGGRDFAVTLSLDFDVAEPESFIAGDYWLVLLRDTRAGLSAEALSAEPVGIHHHYMSLGWLTTDSAGATTFTLDKSTWRRLSFPSLTRLTLDRVLVTNASGDEVSVDDKFVDVDGDTMTGPLKFKPPGTGAEAAWIKATAAQRGTTIPATLELGIDDGGQEDIMLTASGSIVLDAEDNVGVGTNTPAEKLDVNGMLGTNQFKLRDGTPQDGDVLVSDDTGVGRWSNVFGSVRLEYVRARDGHSIYRTLESGSYVTFTNLDYGLKIRVEVPSDVTSVPVNANRAVQMFAEVPRRLHDDDALSFADRFEEIGIVGNSTVNFFPGTAANVPGHLEIDWKPTDLAMKRLRNIGSVYSPALNISRSFRYSKIVPARKFWTEHHSMVVELDYTQMPPGPSGGAFVLAILLLQDANNLVSYEFSRDTYRRTYAQAGQNPSVSLHDLGSGTGGGVLKIEVEGGQGQTRFTVSGARSASFNHSHYFITPFSTYLGVKSQNHASPVRKLRVESSWPPPQSGPRVLLETGEYPKGVFLEGPVQDMRLTLKLHHDLLQATPQEIALPAIATYRLQNEHFGST